MPVDPGRVPTGTGAGVGVANRRKTAPARPAIRPAANSKAAAIDLVIRVVIRVVIRRAIAIRAASPRARVGADAMIGATEIAAAAINR
jgi:hypothetical protein